jgi:hypothetical protein
MPRDLGLNNVVPRVHPILDFNVKVFARILHKLLKIWTINSHDP